jgi:hypothetical protein
MQRRSGFTVEMGDANPERASAREKPIPMGELDHLADRSVDSRGDPSVATHMTVPRLTSVSCFGMQ